MNILYPSANGKPLNMVSNRVLIQPFGKIGLVSMSLGTLGTPNKVEDVVLVHIVVEAVPPVGYIIHRTPSIDSS